jgi:quercetin dioxygenase-like cupin family protein
MTAEEFSVELRKQGLQQFALVDRRPNEALDLHTHPFESQALVLEGEISISTQGRERLYRAGEVFHLDYAQEHSERYGPQGVRYLVARR